jgi:type I restriction-modification system DNA methylase subunit
MWLTVEERVFVLEGYLKTMSYAHCKQRFFEKFRRQAPVKRGVEMYITLAIKEVNERTLRKFAKNMVERVDMFIEMNGHHFQHLL